jgi:glycosyltransferase involved in cell wall biosynthesis
MIEWGSGKLTDVDWRPILAGGGVFSGAAVVPHRDFERTRLVLADLYAQEAERAAETLRLLKPDATLARTAGDSHGACRAAIAVCTAKRPKMLGHCLESVASQIVAAPIAVDVVVVDNEGEPNNRSLVQDFSARCRFPVHYVHQPRRGIPQARNAALQQCRELGADWIAFTDDDCWVSPTWLASLLDAAAKHGADVVYGRREFFVPAAAPFWAMGPERATYAEGQELAYAGTHNVLLAARVIGQGGDAMRFDERLAHGEDTDFFYRAALRGSRIVYSAEPLVLETLLPDRATLRYQTRRAYHYAASRSYFHRRYRGAAIAAFKLAGRWAFQAPAAITQLAIAPLAWPFSQDIFRGLVTKGTGRLAGAAGAAAGLVGFVGNPYHTIDGY